MTTVTNRLRGAIPMSPAEYEGLPRGFRIMGDRYGGLHSVSRVIEEVQGASGINFLLVREDAHHALWRSVDIKEVQRRADSATDSNVKGVDEP